MMTKADKIAFAFIALFFIGLPLLFGFVAVFEEAPEAAAGAAVIIGGIGWGLWKVDIDRARLHCRGVVR
jgi:hypothetical protein